MDTNKPVVGITMGDPAGIGPEISLMAYTDKSIAHINKVIIGNIAILKKVARRAGISVGEFREIKDMDECVFLAGKGIDVIDIPFANLGDLQPGKVQAIAGDAAFKYLTKGIEMALAGEIDGIATAPLNKEALHLAGHLYPGHTEILAHYTGTKDYAMLLYDEQLKVIHVTTHISLKEVVETLNKDRIYTVIKIAHNTLRELGYQKPRIAVAGLNPHAGEGGLFGDEEEREIIPAVERAKADGIQVLGPIPPDTVFLKGKNGEYDIIVAMYHDQGHIPIKLLGFHTGVNITAGLPIIRTSVDHGTAFGRAWEGRAHSGSMIRAIFLCGKLAEGRLNKL